MRQRSSVVGLVISLLLGTLLTSNAVADPGSGAELSEWDVTSYKVNLTDHRGAGGDVQTDQNGWIHLGANHLEGGDITYEISVGELTSADILEVWIDGYSTSNALDIGPTVFIGTGKNRYEQITRLTGDAWRPFVFRFADDSVYGDITDPANRNENWRIRYPSSKYETRRIDKAPNALLDKGVLPVMISMTGAEDFVIKRIEVVVYRSRQGVEREGLYMVNLTPGKVRRGEMVTVVLSRALPSEHVDFYIIDPNGREYTIVPRILAADKTRVGIYTGNYPFSKNGWYQVKLVDRSVRSQKNVDIKGFEYVDHRTQPVAEPTPKILSPEIECAPPMVGCVPVPPMLPPIPQAPPGYISPVMPDSPPVVGPPSYVQGYTIQVGAFQVQSVAVALRDRLRREGFDAYITEGVKHGKRFFRVRVGRYADKSFALQEAYRLKSRGFDTWVTELS